MKHAGCVPRGTAGSTCCTTSQCARCATTVDDPAAFDEHIRLRNRLCANPVLAKQDKVLKSNLTRRYPNERTRHTESKRTFMRSDCKDCTKRPTAPDLQAWPESLCPFGAQTMNRLRPAQNMRRKSFVAIGDRLSLFLDQATGVCCAFRLQRLNRIAIFVVSIVE